MQFATINGITMHYKRCGQAGAPILVFSNSLGTDLRIWDGVLAELEDHFDILLYDKRGHGLSSNWSGPESIQTHADDLANLMNELEITGAIIVGLSVGGMIAQVLQARHPDHVRALVLCDTAHKIGTSDMWNERIKQIEAGGIAALSAAIMDRWLSAGFRSQHQPMVDGLSAMLTRTPQDGYVATCAAIRDEDLTSVARSISVPTLCIAGTEDASTPPDLVRDLAGLIPGAMFLEIHGAGHLPCIEQPKALARHLVTFIMEHNLG